VRPQEPQRAQTLVLSSIIVPHITHQSCLNTFSRPIITCQSETLNRSGEDAGENVTVSLIATFALLLIFPALQTNLGARPQPSAHFFVEIESLVGITL